MEHHEKHAENVERTNEKHQLEGQRQKAPEVSEKRIKKASDKGVEKPRHAEQKALSVTKHPENVAQRRSRVDELARKKGVFSASERRELDQGIDKAMYQGDRTKQKADEHADQEAKRLWANDPKLRREMGHIMGTEAHKEYAEKVRRQEHAKGHIEGKDYGVEKPLRHPDGKQEKPDVDNYRTHILHDLKPMSSQEKPEQFLAKHKKQRERQQEAHEHTKGHKVEEYHHPTYPSMKDYHKIPEGELPNVKELVIKKDQQGKEEVFAEYRTDALPKTGKPQEDAQEQGKQKKA